MKRIPEEVAEQKAKPLLYLSTALCSAIFSLGHGDELGVDEMYNAFIMHLSQILLGAIQFLGN